MSFRYMTLAAHVGAALVLGACSTDSFNEAVGLSKNSPDETQVAANRPLAIPPDYSLVPPVDPAPAPAAAPQTAAVQQPAPANAAGTVEADPTTTASVAAAPAPSNGISPTHPDGTPKTKREIQEEARKLRLARKKAENPNYGTWRNIFNIWD